MESINQLQDQIIDDFELLGEEWMDKYEYLIELGKGLEPLSEECKAKQNLIEGCQSRVWLDTTLEGEHIRFKADSDAIITKGLIALLIKIFDNRTPQEIIDTNLYFIDKIGLSQNLSPTRANGLASMVKQIRMYALAYQTKLKNTH